MVDTVYGAVCTLDLSADGSVMTTHRLSKEDWDAAVAAFSTNQASITDAIVATAGDLSTVTVGTNNALDYMDALHCEKEDSDDYFTCSSWQVDWRSDALSDGYPRFGTTDPVMAGIIDSTAMTTIALQTLILSEAATLIAGTVLAFLTIF